MTVKKTVKKTVAKKPVAKKKFVGVPTTSMVVEIDVTHRLTVVLDVVNGDTAQAVSDFIGNDLCSQFSSNTFHSIIEDEYMANYEINSEHPSVPETVSASNFGVSIEGSGAEIKAIVEQLRETYDASGTDMPKVLHDLVFSLETQLGIV